MHDFVRELVVDEYNNLYGFIIDNIEKYYYDSWGRIIDIIDESSDNISNLNSFKYKDYYYDQETELYYLESRYYYPFIHRFISIDNPLSLRIDDINSLNLYSYSGNNPIMMADPDGHILKAGPSVLASIATGGLYGGIGGYLSYEEQIGSNKSWSTIQKNYWKSKGYSHAPDGVDGYPKELNHIYGRYGSKRNIFKETTHTEHVRFHQLYGNGRGSGGFNRYYPFTNIWEWLK